jgi:hypothetical protein
MMRLPSLPPFRLPDLTVQTPSSSAAAAAAEPLPEMPPPSLGGSGTRPARWRSAEFRLYALAVLVGVLLMVRTGASFGPGERESPLVSPANPPPDEG